MGKKEKKQSSKSTVSESSGGSSEKSTSGKGSTTSVVSQPVSSTKPKSKKKSKDSKLHKQNFEHGSGGEANKKWKTPSESKLAIDGHGNTVINIYVNGKHACLNFVLPDAIKKRLVKSDGVTIDLDDMLKKKDENRESDSPDSPTAIVKEQKKVDGNPK